MRRGLGALLTGVTTGGKRALALALFSSFSFASLAAEQPARMESYLKRLGYGVAQCQSDRPNKLVVKGKLGKKKRLFLVDTGWGITALDQGSAKGLKTLREAGVTPEGTNSSWMLTGVVIEKLQLGDGLFSDQPAAVESLSMDYITTDLDGILGLDFLVRNHCLIDCGERRLYFRGGERSPEQTSALIESLRRSGFLEAGMAPEVAFAVNTKIQDHDTRLLVDTGSYFSMLDASQIERLSLSMERSEGAETGTLIPREFSSLSMGVGKIGAHQFRVTTVSAVEMAGLKWNNVHFGVLDMKSWGIGAKGNGLEDIQGTLGADMLILKGALIDCDRRTLWFRPVKRTSK